MIELINRPMEHYYVEIPAGLSFSVKVNYILIS